VKSHAFFLSERPQGDNRSPEPIGRLGHQHEVLALHLGSELAGLLANPVYEFSHLSHPRHLHRGFVTPLPWRNGFIHLGAWFSGASRRATHRLGHLNVCPGGGAPQCCFHRRNGYWQDDSAVGCGLEWPTWFFWVKQGECPECPTVTSFFPLGDLISGGALRDVFTSLLPLPSSDSPCLVGSGAEESISAFAPLTGRPATTLAYAAPTSA
jgi:hypothetical protein